MTYLGWTATTVTPIKDRRYCLRHDDGAVLWNAAAGEKCWVCRKRGQVGFPPANPNTFHDSYHTNWGGEPS